VATAPASQAAQQSAAENALSMKTNEYVFPEVLAGDKFLRSRKRLGFHR
jgi:hypothetical protein